MWPLLAIGGVVLAKILYDEFGYQEDDIPARRIFISHSWRKSSYEYEKFVNKLEIEGIDHYNHSIPEYKAFAEYRKSELRKIFTSQMLYCSKVFVLAKNGISSKSFVGVEIEIARELGKNIIAIKPHGQIGIPKFIEKEADMIISNNISSIRRALRD